MRKFGFKLFSSNLQTTPDIINECAEFVNSVPDAFVELTALQSASPDDFIKLKQELNNAEVRIHASYIGLDTGNRALKAHNRNIVALAQKVADMFDSKTIIVHPGCGHDRQYVEETAEQFRSLHDERIVVENLPYWGRNKELLHGYNAKEIGYIMQESGCGFCLDFSHAVCAALSTNMEIETQLKELFALKPRVYHICDGDIKISGDCHWHFGAGNYPLRHFIADFTDENAYITMETGQGAEPHCEARIKDYHYLKSLLPTQF